MKILIINHSDTYGGAAISAHRLFIAINNANKNVTLEVFDKNTADSIKSLNKKYNRVLYKLKEFIASKIITFFFRTSNTILHSLNNKSLIDVNKLNASDADIVNLHWINHNLLSIKDISTIKKPIFWTLHDSWSICGAEHHPNILENDNRYQIGYFTGNKPRSTRGFDLCKYTWKRKKKAWKNKTFHFIAPSNFLKTTYEESALFKGTSSTCTVIPNIVPEDIFKPLDKSSLRVLYDIPEDKHIIGFGAAYEISSKKSIKGEYLLIEALKLIKDPENYHLVLFGNAGVSFLEALTIPYFNSGYISNPHILAGIYNLCDVIICPSLIENLPNICLEALFCGIPVTAFNTGGIPDIVEHKQTGYLADCFDPKDLHNGVQYSLGHKEELSKNSLIKAKRDFDNQTIVNKHIELYKSVLEAQ